MDGGISRHLAGTEEVDEKITRLNENTTTMDKNLIDESTEDVERIVQVDSKGTI